MASVTLYDCWLKPVADLSAGRNLQLNDTPKVTPGHTISIDRYAGATFRPVTTPGRQLQVELAINFASDDDQVFLETWAGQLVCYLDQFGRKFYGQYFDESFSPRAMGDSWACPITVIEQTYSEEVTP